MTGKGNHRFAQYIVKIPGISPIDGESVKSFSGFCRVEHFSQADNMARDMGPRADGERPIQDPAPVSITVAPGLMARIKPLFTKGELSESIECVELALKDQKPVRTFEQKLKGCVLSSGGDNTVVVMSYSEYERKTYSTGKPTSEFGFDFQNQEVTVS